MEKCGRFLGTKEDEKTFINHIPEIERAQKFLDYRKFYSFDQTWKIRIEL